MKTSKTALATASAFAAEMTDSLIHAAYFTPGPDGRWGLPVLFEGEPGAGKTATLKAFMRRVGAPCRVLSWGKDGEGAFGVIPVPGKEYLHFLPADWCSKFTDGGLIFVDEVTTMPATIQPSAMSLLTEHTLGSHEFGPRVRVMGACNPVDLAAAGYDLAPPLANRFGHIAIKPPSVEAHAAYMLSRAAGGIGEPIDAVAEEARVLAAWPAAYARAVGLEVAFLRARPEMKNQCPRAGAPASSKAWASDRTWTLAVHALAGAAVHGLSDEERDTLVSAFIGAAVYEEWAAFIESADLPDVAALLDGKVAFQHNPDRLDRTAAVLTAATALVLPAKAPRRDERAEALWALLDAVGAANLDVIAPCVEELVRASLHKSKKTMAVLSRVQPLISAARASLPPRGGGPPRSLRRNRLQESQESLDLGAPHDLPRYRPRSL
jgi:MoxR-like ATPase